MKTVLWTAVITVVVLVAISAIVVATGAVNMGASVGPGAMERALARFAFERSVAVRAPERENPFKGDAEAISAGLEHYGMMCARCHGGPGVEAAPFAKGLNPPAPDLEHAAEEFSDGELFWVVNHGIRMTGMPSFGVTHGDEALWRITAFLRELPNLSAEQKEALSEVAGRAHEHGPSASDEHDHSSHEHDDHHHGQSDAEKEQQSGHDESPGSDEHGTHGQ